MSGTLDPVTGVFGAADDATVEQSIVASPVVASWDVAEGGTIGQLIIDPVTAVFAPASDVRVDLGPALVDITDDDIFDVVKAWLNSVLGTAIPVVRGQDNNVPEPDQDDWVEVTPGPRSRIGTVEISYEDPAINQTEPPYVVGTIIYTQPTQVNVQVDIHGPFSAQNAQIVMTLFFSFDACWFFAQINPNIAPIDVTEPKQLAFVNEGSQYEDRWTMDLSVQANISTRRPQQFFSAEPTVNIFPEE